MIIEFKPTLRWSPYPRESYQFVPPGWSGPIGASVAPETACPVFWNLLWLFSPAVDRSLPPDGPDTRMEKRLICSFQATLKVDIDKPVGEHESLREFARGMEAVDFSKAFLKYDLTHLAVYHIAPQHFEGWTKWVALRAQQARTWADIRRENAVAPKFDGLYRLPSKLE